MKSRAFQRSIVSRRVPATTCPPAAEDVLVFVDLETTGGQAWRPIMQIAAVAVTRTGQELETFERKLRFAEKRATLRALRKREYQQASWHREAQRPAEVARDFAAFLTRHATVRVTGQQGRPLPVAQLVAHNAAFDGPFLRHWFAQQRMFLPADYRVYCTLQRALWLFQEQPSLIPPRDFKLGTLCQYFGIPWSRAAAHDALHDVRATVQLYRQLRAASAHANRDLRDVSVA